MIEAEGIKGAMFLQIELYIKEGGKALTKPRFKSNVVVEQAKEGGLQHQFRSRQDIRSRPRIWMN